MIKNVVKRGFLDDNDLRDSSNYVILGEVETAFEEEGGFPYSAEFIFQLGCGTQIFETGFHLSAYNTEDERAAKTKEYVAYLHNLINAAEDYLDTVISMVNQFEEAIDGYDRD